MSQSKFLNENQAFEVDKVVMLERLRRDTNGLTQQLIENGLNSPVSKRVALALAGKINQSTLDENELRFMRQVDLLT